jgi:hypothetical protein
LKLGIYIDTYINTYVHMYLSGIFRKLWIKWDTLAISVDGHSDGFLGFLVSKKERKYAFWEKICLPQKCKCKNVKKCWLKITNGKKHI